MIIPRKIGLVAAASVCLVASSLGAKEFAWKLEPGKTYEHVVKQDLTRTTPGAPAGASGNTIKMEVTSEWRVIDRDSDGNTIFEARVKRMKMQMNGPQGNISIDSDDKESLQTRDGQKFGEVFAKIQKVMVTQTMSPQGKIVESKISSTDGEGGLPMIPGISSDQIKEMMIEDNLTFPKKNLKPGDSWTQSTTAPIPVVGGGLKMERKVKYVGTETVDGRSLDRFDADITLKPSGENPKAKFDGSGRSTTYFNAEKGLAEKTELEFTVAITYSLFGQESVLSLRSRTVATLTEKK